MLEEESHPLSRSIKMKNMENIGGSGPPGPLNWHNQEYTVGGTQDRTLTLPPRDHGDRTTTKRPLPHDHPNLAESFRPTEKALIEKAKSLRLHIPTSKLRSSKPLSPENASQNEIETLLRHELQQSEFSRSNQTLTECSVPSQFIDLTASAASVSFSIIISCKANKLSRALPESRMYTRVYNLDRRYFPVSLNLVSKMS